MFCKAGSDVERLYSLVVILLKFCLGKNWMEKWIKVWYELPFHPPSLVLTCRVSVLGASRQKHGNVIGIFQIVQKFSKKPKFIWNALPDKQIFQESPSLIIFYHFLRWRENFNKKSSKFNTCSPFSLSCLSSNFTPMYLTQFTILFFEPSFISFVEKHNICLSYY